MKLLLAAPLSALPFDPMALGEHTSLLHFVMKLFFAAPTNGLPFFPTALLSHVSCPAAEAIAKAISNAAYINFFILTSFWSELARDDLPGFRRDAHARLKRWTKQNNAPAARAGKGLFAAAVFTAGRLLFLGRCLLPLLLLNNRLLLIRQTLPVLRSFDQSGSRFRI
jgi:hypothetical protein